MKCAQVYIPYIFTDVTLAYSHVGPDVIHMLRIDRTYKLPMSLPGRSRKSYGAEFDTSVSALDFLA